MNNFNTLYKKDDFILLSSDQLNTNTNKSKYKNHHHKSISYVKMLNEEQNDRFFESNTLYKKELKQKQRDILNNSNTTTTTTTLTSTSSSPNQPLQSSYKSSISTSILDTDLQSSNKFTTPIIQIEQSEQNNNNNVLKSNSFTIMSPQNSINSSQPESMTKLMNKNIKEKKHNSQNKMLNIFSNFLNRNKSSSPSQSTNILENSNENSNNNSNYLNLKYLKRASSTSFFTNL